MATGIAPAPSSSRGTVVVQPAYFTSDLYVNPLRDDLMSLSHKYIQRYNVDSSKPFQLFKDVWKEDGWPWLHFKVFDPRSRDMFLNVTLRIFLEGTIHTQPPIKRVIALFGLYTFYYTQPSSSAPPIHAVSRIPIPIDVYTSLIALPNLLNTPLLSPLRACTAYLVNTLVKDQVFDILPSSELYPLNPRVLPREIYRPIASSQTTSNDAETIGKRKAGRPSKHEKARKAQDALDKLEKWLKDTSYTPEQTSLSTTGNAPDSDLGASTPMDTSPGNVDSGGQSTTTHRLLSTDPVASRVTYQNDKSELLKSLMADSSASSSSANVPLNGDASNPGIEKSEGRKALERANQFILLRVRKLEEDAKKRGLEVGGEGGDLTTLSRVEKAAAEINKDGDEWKGGILGLSNGGGN